MRRPLLLLVLALAVLPLRAQTAWERVAPMPTPRAYAAVAVLNGQVYVIGGRGPGGAILGTVERYNPASDTWQRVASLREPRYNASATVLGNRILLTGGYSAEDGVTDDVEVYVPGENDWESFDSLEHSREGHGAFTVNGFPYVFGGSSPGGAFRDDAEYYDVEEGYWDEYPAWTLDTPRAAFATVPMGNGVLVFGGFSLSGPVDEVEFYVPQQGGTLRARMQDPRGGLAGAGDDEHAWAVGGRNADDVVVGQVDVYDLDDDRWLAGLALPEPREGAVAAVVNGKLLVFGGQDGQGTLQVSSYRLTAIVAAEPGAPGAEAFVLEAAGPNPFRDGTRVALRLAAPASAAVAVYDALGRCVAVLHDGVLPAGRHVLGWDGTDAAGRGLPSGAYAVQAVAGEQRAAIRLTLVR